MYILDLPVIAAKWENRTVWPLFGIGDPHLDKASTNRERLKAYVDLIAATGNVGFAHCVGDVFDGTTPSHRFFSTSTIRPEDALAMDEYVHHMIEEAVQVFLPILVAGKPLTITEGNHDLRLKNIGFIQLLVAALNREAAARQAAGRAYYLGGEALIRVRAALADQPERNATWVVYTAHGAGGGMWPGGKVNRATQQAHIADADIFIRGHVEEQDVRILDRYAVPRRGDVRLVMRPVCYYTCAGYATERRVGVVDYSGRASMMPVDRTIRYLEVHNPDMHSHFDGAIHDINTKL